MRKSYSELFTINNGMVMPKVSVEINGVIMGPGVAFGKGVSFGGVDLTSLIGKDLEVELKDGITRILGYYP